jgi:hypothetical protein
MIWFRFKGYFSARLSPDAPVMINNYRMMIRDSSLFTQMRQDAGLALAPKAAVVSGGGF